VYAGAWCMGGFLLWSTRELAWINFRIQPAHLYALACLPCPDCSHLTSTSPALPCSALQSRRCWERA